MARAITITDEHKKALITDFLTYLKITKLSDGKITFNKTIGMIERKAELRFTETAWLKMQALIREFDKEVAWHGTAFRDEDETLDLYHIKDIFVYPQEVSGATVNTDQKEYEDWLYDSLESEQFRNLRMQGHSHVNMATSPSSVDLAHQAGILNQLGEDMFYIFLIWNKRGERNIKIYDRKKNVLFESSDVSVTVDDTTIGLDKFIKESKQIVKAKTYTTPATNVKSFTTAEQKPKTETKKPADSGKKKLHRKGKGNSKPGNLALQNACDKDYAYDDYYKNGRHLPDYYWYGDDYCYD